MACLSKVSSILLALAAAEEAVRGEGPGGRDVLVQGEKTRAECYDISSEKAPEEGAQELVVEDDREANLCVLLKHKIVREFPNQDIEVMLFGEEKRASWGVKELKMLLTKLRSFKNLGYM